MKVCTENITIYNSYIDKITRFKAYIPTKISGVSWYGSLEAAVTADGLIGADKYTIRIPTDAQIESSKKYLSPKAYAAQPNDQKSKYWTIGEGDCIVKGFVDDIGSDAKPDKLEEKYDNVVTVISVTDNRRVDNAPHWRVVCK